MNIISKLFGKKKPVKSKLRNARDTMLRSPEEPTIKKKKRTNRVVTK